MGDLVLEEYNEAESGTYLASSTYDWNPLITYSQPVFTVYKEDNRGYAVQIWAATGGLYCEGDNGAGGYFSGGTYGVFAKARDNYGVFGEASKEAQAGVFGLNKAPGSFGVVGQTTGDKGIGVVGQTLGDKGIGVAGQVTAASGIGVQGYANSGIGLHGFTESGAGVQGVATSGNGVEGFSSSPDHAGVYGSHDAKEGTCYGVIPVPVDQNSCAHWRRPMDMILQGWSTSLFHASQQWSTRSS
jgi:hypothetical protein